MGVYRDNGKENGDYYRGYIYLNLGCSAQAVVLNSAGIYER